MTTRSIYELLQLVDAEPADPFIGDRVVEAYQAGVITTEEARHLQSFERRSPKGRKRALADAVDVTPEGVAAMKAKLQAKLVELNALRAGGDVA